jgi:hypothetical protein
MITKFQLYEAKGRPKDKWVKCIKNYDYVLNDEHVAVNPHLTPNDKHVYPFFEKDKMYKMHGPLETIRGDYIVYVSTNIKHSIGPPDYEKFISMCFAFDKEKSRKFMSSDNHFEDYFEMTEETKKLIEWYYIKKDAKKYNL